MFHRHKWIVVEMQEQPSLIDSLGGSANITRIKTGLGVDPNRREMIVHYRCVDCGKERVQRI